MKDLEQSIKSREKFELVYINNTKNCHTSASALNLLNKVTTGDLIFYTHQDVTFTGDEPLKKTETILTQVGNFGIAGPAGVKYRGGHYINGVDFASKKYNFNHMIVDTLDEFCLIAKRDTNLEFGEYLDHFHFYGADICCVARYRGLNNYVIDVPIKHMSGGADNLLKDDGYERYKQQARKFYKKWGKIFPLVSTTTARFNNVEAYYFLADTLKLNDVIEMIAI
jgi:hypothetical protein